AHPRSRHALHARDRRRVPVAGHLRRKSRRSARDEIAGAAGAVRARDSLERVPQHQLLAHRRRRVARAGGVPRGVDRPEAGGRHRIGPPGAARNAGRTGVPAHIEQLDEVTVSTFSLDGKVAVVTGGLGLLGRQHCWALLEAGAHVAVADLDRDAANQFACELTKRFGRRAQGCYVDITDPEAVSSLCDEVQRTLGPIDELVNNAAIDDKALPGAGDETSALERYPLDRWKALLDTNVTGTFLCCQIVGRGMADRQAGSIVNIASTYGVVAPDQALYRNADGSQC